MAACRYNYDLNYKHGNFFYLLKVVTTFSTQHQTLFVFLQSEASSDNKRDKTKSCKHQSHEGV